MNRIPTYLRLSPRRLTSVVLILVLIAPGLPLPEFGLPTFRVFAAKIEAPSSALPPQPFHINGGRNVNNSPSLLSIRLAMYLFAPPSVGDSNKADTSPSNEEIPDAVSNGVDETDDSIEEAIPEIEEEAEPGLLLPTQPAAAVDFDFDGDNKSDLARWQPANTEFKIKNSNGGSYSTYTNVGTSSDILAPADYDNDGKTDVATFNAGTWKIRESTSGTVTTITGFGQAGDIPMSGNYRTTSTADELAFFRPSNSTWYWREVGNSTVYSMGWGQSGDIPVAGDFDGDGLMDPAIFRPTTGYWYWTLSGTSSNSNASWGQAGDVPIAADYDGDGKADLTVFRPSTGIWYVKESDSSYTTWVTQSWGNYNDQPVAGDFDGDSKADFAIWRPSSGVWYIIKSSNSSFMIEALGAPGDTALASSYVGQVGSNVEADLIAQARLAPKNATGGTDLYSQNFSWGRQLVSLPGRSGLDLGLGISYNSLVWTKVGSTMLFDQDYSNVSPGFRLDFPTIETAYYDDETDKYNYLMVTTSGARLQFRQTAVSNVYETVDSSYLQLVTGGEDDPNDPVEGITIKVYSTDGTEMSYEWKGGAYRCGQIKDRNGN